jgi:hypothetical protein
MNVVLDGPMMAQFSSLCMEKGRESSREHLIDSPNRNILVDCGMCTIKRDISATLCRGLFVSRSRLVSHSTIAKGVVLKADFTHGTRYSSLLFSFLSSSSFVGYMVAGGAELNNGLRFCHLEDSAPFAMKRRQFASPSALDLSTTPQPTPNVSSRAASPSVFSAFLRGPTTRWFTKGKPGSKPSDGDASSKQPPLSPRRPKISRPTDPRPLLDIPALQLSSSRFVSVFLILTCLTQLLCSRLDLILIFL